MKVHEIIEVLKTYPQDYRICLRESDSTYGEYCTEIKKESIFEGKDKFKNQEKVLLIDCIEMYWD